MVLVSSPERVVQGVICELGASGDVPGDTKNGPLSAGPPGFVVCAADDQVEGKMPKALTLATACVRLWTPSLP
jgi:hypothetical protein